MMQALHLHLVIAQAISKLSSYLTSSLKVIILILASCSVVTDVSAMMPPGGMPDISPEEFEKFVKQLEEDPQMQKLMQQIQADFEKLPKDVQDQLTKEAEDQFKRMNIDPYTLKPSGPTVTTPEIKPTEPLKQPAQPTPAEPTSDCSEVTSHSSQQASCLLNHTITYLEITRGKLHALNLETHKLHEWLNALSYYLKIINKPEHLRRLISVDFNHLFELISELEQALRTESSELTVLYSHQQNEHDDPYAILTISSNATDEDIKKAYDKKMSEYDAQQLEKDLTEARVSPLKIAQRVRQAKARQATITDAFDQLSDQNLRAQIDTHRLHNREQQALLDAANTAATTRLLESVNTLIQQGIITELEEFLKRYAPQEARLQQSMTKAEAEQFAQQRTPPTPFIASPTAGFNPFGTYQPNFYQHPPYFPPTSNYPTSFPGSGSSGAASSDKGSASRGGDSSKKEAPKKEDKKEQSAKKPEQPKKKKEAKKKKEDDSIKTGFKKLLDNLKTPLTKLKDYLTHEDQGDIKKHLATLDESRKTRTPLSITDQSLGKLHKGLETYVNPDFAAQVMNLAQFIQKHIAQNQKAIDECRPLWEAHHKTHKVAYDFLNSVCNHARTAYQSNPKIAEQKPWVTAAPVCEVLAAITKLFEKPPQEKEKKEKEQKEKQAPGRKTPGKKEKPGKPSPEKTTAESSKKEVTQEEFMKTVQETEALYKAIHEKLADASSELATSALTTRKKLSEKIEAIAPNELEIYNFLRTDWKPLLKDLGLDRLISLKRELQAMLTKLKASDKEQAKALILELKAKIKEDYQLVESFVTMNTAALKFLKEKKQEIAAKMKEFREAQQKAQETVLPPPILPDNTVTL